MSKRPSKSNGRDYELPIVWHDPVVFDMGARLDSPPGPRAKPKPPQSGKKTKGAKKRKPRN